MEALIDSYQNKPFVQTRKKTLLKKKNYSVAFEQAFGPPQVAAVTWSNAYVHESQQQ